MITLLQRKNSSRFSAIKPANPRMLALLALLALLPQSLPAGAQQLPVVEQVTAPRQAAAPAPRAATSSGRQVINGENLTAGQLNQMFTSGARSYIINTTTPISGDLLIPKGVTLIDVIGKNDTALSIEGNLTHSGSLIFTGARGLQATLNANNILVNPGALISTLNRISLNINALGNIINAGTISSSGNLNLNAGGSITNALQGLQGSQPVIQALQNINLFAGSGNLTNSGLIHSIGGNVNIAAATANHINLENAFGTIHARNAINFRDAGYTGSADIKIFGGSLLSKVLNLDTGKGTVDAFLDHISGVVNVTACNSHIGTFKSPNLTFGKLNVSGDPTYFNTNGDVSFDGTAIGTTGTDLAILASGNIEFKNGSTINTSGVLNGGNLLMVAGGNLAPFNTSGSDDKATVITITNGKGSGGGSTTGGSITVDGTSTIQTTGTLGGDGGNIQLIAYSGSNSNTGLISIASAITSGGNGLASKNGSVTAIAGATSGNSISIAGVDTRGSTATAGTGPIVLSTASPTINGGGTINVLDGTPTGDVFVPNSFQKSNIVTTGTLSTNGAGIQIAAGGNITIGGDLQTSAQGLFQTGGPVALLCGGNLTTAPGASPFSILTISVDHAGDVALVAGANLQAATGQNQVTLNGPSTSGGSVNFSTLGPAGATSAGIAIFTNTSAAQYRSSGDVDMIAFLGSAANSGQVNLEGGSVTISTGAPSNRDPGGRVTVIAGASSGNSINIVDIDTKGGGADPNSGAIAMNTATPTTGAGITYSSGTPSAFFGVGASQNSSILLGSLNGAGAAIDITAGSDITLTSTITVLSNTPTGPSFLTLDAGGIFTVPGGATGQITVASQAGGSFFGGGKVSITADTIAVSGTGQLQINVDGVTAGSGGTVSITQLSNTADLIIGTQNNKNNIQISALSGAAGGSGGIINLTSGADLLIDTAAFDASPNAAGNGTGAQLTFTAGTSGSGRLQIDGPGGKNPGALDVSGAGTGSGGIISLTSNSSATFNVDGKGSNFVNGTLTADGGPTSGNGGSVTVINLGTGGVNLSSPSSISVQPTVSGNGGSIDLEAPAGILTLGNGDLGADSVGAGTGGSIRLIASSFVFPTTGGGFHASTNTGSIVVNSGFSGATSIVDINDFIANDVALIAPNGAYTLTGTNIVVGSNSQALITKNSITSLAGFSPSTNTFILAATGSGSTVGTSTTRLVLDAPSLTAQATIGSVFIRNTNNGGDLNLVDSVVDGTTFKNLAGSTYSLIADGLVPLNNINTTTAGVTGTNVDLTSSGGFTMVGPITATNSISLISNDSILPSSVPSLTAPTVVLAATDTGSDIGIDSLNRVVVTASNLTAQASNGSVFVENNSAGDAFGNVSLVNSTVNGTSFTNNAANTFSFLASGIAAGTGKTVNSSVSITGDDVVLTSSGGFKLSGSVTGSNMAALISNDSITSIGPISADTIVLAATGLGSTIGSGATTGRLVVNAANLTASAGDAVFISSSSAGDINGDVNLVDSTVDGVPFVNGAGAIYSFEATGVSSGKNLAVLNIVSAAGSVDLTSSGGISFPSGNIFSSSVALITQDSITDVPVVSTNLTLVAAGAGSDIGTSPLARLGVNATTLTLNANDSVFVDNVAAGDVNGDGFLQNTSINGVTFNNSAGGTFSLVASGLTKNLVTAANVNLSGNNVDLTSNGGFSLAGSISATTSAAIISVDSITPASIAGISTPALVLAATGVGANIGVDENNRVSINAANLTAQSDNGDVFIQNISSGDASFGNVNLVDSTVNGTSFENLAANTYSLLASGIAPGTNITTLAGADITAANVVLSSSGGIALAGNVNAGAGQVALISNDSITSVSSVTSSNLVLAATGIGSTIGTNATSRLSIDADFVTAQANGSIFITNTSTTNPVSLVDATVEGVNYTNTASAVAATFSFKATGLTAAQTVSTTAGNDITADNIVLNSSGGFSLLGSVSGNSVALISNDSITSLGGVNPSNTLILAVTGAGNTIGTSPAVKLNINVPNLTAQASQIGSSVWIIDSATSNINLVNSTVEGSSFTNTAANDFTFIANSLNPGNAINTAAGVDLSATNVALISAAGINLGGNMTGTTQAALISTDSITTVANLSAPNIVLVASGPGANVGTNATTGRLLISNPSTLTVNANGSAFVSADSGGLITLVDSTVDAVLHINGAVGTFDILASSGSLSTGTAAVNADTINLNAVNALTVTGGNLSAEHFILDAVNNVTIQDNLLSANFDAGSGDGGTLTINSSNGSILGGVAAVIALSANGSLAGTGKGGSIGITQLGALDVSGAAGSFSFTANAGQGAGGTGAGGIISALSGGNLSIDPASISANAGLAGGDGGQLSLTAVGVLDFPGVSAISLNGSGSGKGGQITLLANTITWLSGAQALVLNANGSGSGDGGIIDVSSTNLSSNLSVGAGNGKLTLFASSGGTGGNGGDVSILSGGTLTFDSAGVTADPNAAGNGNGAHVSMIALGQLTVSNGSYTYDGVGNGNGGLLHLQGSPISSSNLTLNARSGATGTGNGGTVRYINSAFLPIVMDATGLKINATGGFGGSAAGDGGDVTVLTNGALSIDTSVLNAGPLGTNGSGAKISLTGNTVSAITPGSRLDLIANGGGAAGNGTGNGGSLSVTQASSFAASLGSAASNTYSMSARAGLAGGNGGAVSVSSGSVFVDPAAANVAPQVAGSGGSYSFTATGTGTLGFLLVSAALNANSVGANPVSVGGNITLIANSSKTFMIGNASVLGVKGVNPLSVNGNLANGTVTVTNNGGPLTDAQTALNAKAISFTSGNNGTILVNGTLGGATAQTINLTANGTGKITASKIMQAGTITASSGTGVISLSNVNVDLATNLSANTTGAGTVTVTGKVVSPATADNLNITSASGKSVIVKSIGSLSSSGAINAGIVTLQSTATSATTLSVGGTIITTSGLLTLSAPGDITINSALTGFTGVTATSSKSNMFVNAAINSGAAGAVKLTSTLGSFSSSADISGGKSVTISAPKGSATLASLGQVQSPGALTVTALNGISNNGSVSAFNVLKETVTGAGQSLAVNANLTALTLATSTVTLSSTGSTGSVIAAAGTDISAGKSVTISAPKGSVSTSSIGQSVPNLGTVVITALNSLTSSGPVSAITSIKLSATGTTAGAGVLNVSNSTSLNPAITTLTGRDVTVSGLSMGNAITPLKVKATTSLLLSGTAGLVNVQNTGTTPFTLGTSSAASTLKLVASGGINTIAGGSVTAPTSVNLTGKFITVGANSTIGGTGTGTVSLITTGAGVISGGNTSLVRAVSSIALTSGSGSFGTATTALRIQTPVLNLASTGLVNLNNLGSSGINLSLTTSPTKAFTLNSASTITVATAITTPTSITLATTGNNGGLILNGALGKSTTSSLSLTTVGTGTINPGAFLIQAKDVKLSTGSANIGSLASPFLITALGSMSANGGGLVNVQNQGTVALKLNASSAGTSFTLLSPTKITTAAAITAANAITLQATGSNHAIVVGSTIGSPVTGSVSLIATGTGTITTTTTGTPLVQGINVNLTSGSGSFGSSSISLPVSAFTLKLTTSSTALANIAANNTSGVTLSPLSVLGTGAFTLVNPGAITTGGNITSAGNIKLQTSSNNGSITIGGNITSTGSAGVITLDANGTGQINQTGSFAAKAATVNMSTGLNGQIGSALVPFVIDASTFSAKSDTAGTGTGLVNLSNTRTTPVTLNASSAGSGDFNLNLVSTAATIKGNIAVGSGGDINLLNSGGNIIVTGTIGSGAVNTVNTSVTASNGSISGAGLISASNVDLITGGSGAIGSSSPLKVNAFAVSANTAATGSALVNLSNIFAGFSDLNDSSAAGNFTFKSAATIGNDTRIHDVSAGNGTTPGNILITNTGGNLVTTLGAALTANNGFLTLLNSNTTSGNIVIGAETQLNTTGDLGKNVSVLIGATTTVAGTPPAGVNYFVDGKSAAPPPTKFFFGTKGITVSNPSTIDIGVIGAAKVIFNTGTRPNTAITVNGSGTATHTFIQADPPIGLTSSAPLTNAYVKANLTPSSINLAPQPSTAANNSAAGSNMVGVPRVDQFTDPSSYTTVTQPALFTSAIQPNGSTMTATQVIPALNATPRNLPFTADLENGEVPASVFSDSELGITSTMDSAIEIESAQRGPGQPSVLKAGDSALEGGLSLNVGSCRQLTLKKGAVLFAPTTDSVIKTEYGSVKVDAGSLVLLLSFANGIAVYDFDDMHRGAVSVSSEGKHMQLHPGMNLVLTNNSIKYFDQINPLLSFSYRDIDGHEMGNGIKAFSAEFSVPLAIKSLQPLKQLFASKHQNARKIALHLLKTTAARQHFHANGSRFQQIPRPATTAWAQ